MTTTGGAIHILDAANGKQLASFREMSNQLSRFWSVADINGDGRKEIACGDGVDVLLVDADAKLLRRQPFPKTRVAATNDLNGDGRMEILAFQDSRIMVLDFDLNVIASYPLSGPIIDAIVSDIDRDGVNEILVIAGNEKKQIEVVRFARHTRKTLPKDIAIEFLERLRNRQIPLALNLVLADTRQALRTKLRDAPPIVPSNPRLRVVQGQDGTAQVDVENADRLRLTLQNTNSKWWVVDMAW